MVFFLSNNAFSLEKCQYLYHNSDISVFIEPIIRPLNGISVMDIGLHQASALKSGKKISLLGVLPLEVLLAIKQQSLFLACYRKKPIAITRFEKACLIVERGLNI